ERLPLRLQQQAVVEVNVRRVAVDRLEDRAFQLIDGGHQLAVRSLVERDVRVAGRVAVVTAFAVAAAAGIAVFVVVLAVAVLVFLVVVLAVAVLVFLVVVLAVAVLVLVVLAAALAVPAFVLVALALAALAVLLAAAAVSTSWEPVAVPVPGAVTCTVTAAGATTAAFAVALARWRRPGVAGVEVLAGHRVDDRFAVGPHERRVRLTLGVLRRVRLVEVVAVLVRDRVAVLVQDRLAQRACTGFGVLSRLGRLGERARRWRPCVGGIEVLARPRVDDRVAVLVTQRLRGLPLVRRRLVRPVAARARVRVDHRRAVSRRHRTRLDVTRDRFAVRRLGPRGRSPHVVGVELVPGLGVDDRIPVGVEQRFAFSVLRREVDLPEVLTGFRVDDRVAVLVGEVHRREFPLMKLSGFQLVRRGPPSVDGLTRAVVVDVEVLARFRVDHRV